RSLIWHQMVGLKTNPSNNWHELSIFSLLFSVFCSDNSLPKPVFRMDNAMTSTSHVIITGGGSGLGLGIALRYLKRGCRVSILDLVVPETSHSQLDSATQSSQ